MQISLGNYVGQSSKKEIAQALHDVGIWHISPCADVGFKYVLKEESRTIRFITLFCELLDMVNDHSCRMLDSTRILENREVNQIEVLPESIGYNGEVVTKSKKKNEPPKGRESKEDGLPEHPKIDSGFIINLRDNSVFKMGIEMQVRDEGNMPARAVDYGMRIFRYKGENDNVGSKCKVFELSLNRWGITSAPYKLLSISGKEGAECDRNVSEGLVNQICLCCVSLFLGQSINIMGKILDVLKKKYNTEARELSGDDKIELRRLVRESMEKERDVLSQQVVSLVNSEVDVSGIGYGSLNSIDKRVVDRLGFFKYGHLMSNEDVENLEESDLRRDYECIKIEEENVMSDNIDQIAAIWGTIAPYNDKARNLCAQSLKQQAIIASQQAIITNQQAINANQQAINEQLANTLIKLGKGDLVQDIMLQDRRLSQSDEVTNRGSETKEAFAQCNEAGKYGDEIASDVADTIINYIDTGKTNPLSRVTPQSLEANAFSNIFLKEKQSFEDIKSFEEFCNLVYKNLDSRFKEADRAFLKPVENSIEIAKFIYQLPKDAPVKVSEIRSNFSSRKL